MRVLKWGAWAFVLFFRPSTLELILTADAAGFTENQSCVGLLVSSFSFSCVVCVLDKLLKIYNYSISIILSMSSFDLEKKK